MSERGGFQKTERSSIEGIVGGLMVAENMGDVHDEFDLLVARAGLEPLEGNFLEGFTDRDHATLAEAIRKVASE